MSDFRILRTLERLKAVTETLPQSKKLAENQLLLDELLEIYKKRCSGGIIFPESDKLKVNHENNLISTCEYLVPSENYWTNLLINYTKSQLK